MGSKKLMRLLVIHCVMPLFAGAIIYVLFRPVNPLSAVLPRIKRIPISNAWLQFLVDVFPDFCWSYSLAFALYLYGFYYKLHFRCTVLAVFFLLVFSEWVQRYFPRHFTFDIYDLFAAVFAFILSTLQMNKIAYEKRVW
jgi:hypothetical protein